MTAPECSEPVAAVLPLGAVIASVGVSLPDVVVPNAQIAPRIGVTDEWIVRRTGIRTRRVAGPDERLVTHAAHAAAVALKHADVAVGEVDLVLVATTTPDEVMPNAAPQVAHELGATRAGAFDVGAACTGFLSALAVGAGQIESGRVQTAVVIGADLMSRITDPEDRATAAVFADGAGAVVLQAAAQDSRIGPIVLGSDGAGADHIIVPRSEGVIRMRGHETFREAVARLSLATVQAVRAAGARLEDIDLFVYHQANSRIIRTVGERLALDPARVVDYVGRFANASTATLPIALSVA
ncbi:MAG TPA: beta-ketoacyl-ACP synthase 3, partial [Actinopolymorphaceae bacterium]|nr:beta-ketoacyl-ACP synthase 3 [Actinopolymorphaceae bacterium]